VTIVAVICTLSLETIPVIHEGSTTVVMQRSEIFCQDVWCVFGWANKEWISVVLGFGFFTGCICVIGFNYAMKNLNPLIFSSMNMLDPAITGLMSWSAGLEGVPAAGVILGGSIVTVGISLLTVGEQKRDDEGSDKQVCSSEQNDSHGFRSLPSQDNTEMEQHVNESNAGPNSHSYNQLRCEEGPEAGTV
jgi:hypothetical protein